MIVNNIVVTVGIDAPKSFGGRLNGGLEGIRSWQSSDRSAEKMERDVERGWEGGTGTRLEQDERVTVQYGNTD